MDARADRLAIFAKGTIAERWTAARELMATRQLLTVVDEKEFKLAFEEIGRMAQHATGTDQLVAIDLLMRTSKFVKKLAPITREILGRALTEELPDVSLLAESKDLPPVAKPAEFRENIAAALKYGSGDWVVPYALRALLQEDRSQRSRLEFTRQVAARERSIDRWLDQLAKLALSDAHPQNNLENAASRLRDIASSMADVIQSNRIELLISEDGALRLAKLCGLMVPIHPRTKLPKNLGKAAAEVARLLDEIFAVKLTLIVEPEAYAVLETFDRWWRPLPYPKLLREALKPIVDKLVTGITLRARWGQVSESLAGRLRQCIGDGKAIALRLQQIADTEPGLTPDVSDWLRGRRRTGHDAPSTLATSLRAVGDEELVESIASLLLEAHEVLSTPSGTEGDRSTQVASRIAFAIKSLASQRGLEVVGDIGDQVEYLPIAHQMASGEVPTDIKVQIIRPMVVRRRRDGGSDVVLRAIVTDLVLRT